MNKAKMRIALFLLIIAVIASGYGVYWLLYGRFHIEVTDAYVTGNQNQITSQVRGIIRKLNIEETQKVERGEILAEVDDSDYRIALAEAEAALALAVREYQNLYYSVIESERVAAADRSNYSNVEMTYQRDSKAYSKGLISRQQLDDSKNSYTVAKATLGQSEASLDSARTKIMGTDLYSYPPIQKAVEGYKKAYLNLKRTVIYAPVSGTLAKKSVYIGQQVEMNQKLAALIDLEQIWVTANVKETEMENIEVGNYVELVSDFNGKTYKGYVQGISPGSGSALSLLPAQNATGNWIKIVQRVPVRIQIEKKSLEENGSMPVGTSITATVNVKKKSDTANPYAVEASDFYTLDEKEVEEKIKSIISANIFRKEG